MTAILNAKEAFEALQNRKTVLCRYAGDGNLPGDKDFYSLDQMPATVFIMPHYEFCIKIETMELAGITFAKPLVPEDLRDQQEIYIVMPTCILCTKYDAEHTDVHNAVMNGFAQVDADNALLQLKALGAVFGNAIENVEVKDGFEEKPKRKRKQLESKITIDEQCDLLIEAINICDSDAEIENVLENLDEYKFSQKQVNKIFSARAKKSSDFRNSIKETTAEHNTTGMTIIEQGPVEIVEDKLGVSQQVEQYWDHREILNDLIDQVSQANTPAEANAVFQHTKGWTQEQMTPLHAAVSRRLAELPQPEIKDPPSLLVRIQNAPDFVALDELETEVSTRDPFIQKALFDEIKKRRAQIKQFEPDFIEDLS